MNTGTIRRWCADGASSTARKYERAKICERSRRGKLQKARQGKVMAGPRPAYDFRYNDARDNYVVDAETMAVIQRIFHMVGVEGHTMNATRLAFNREGVRPPSGGRFGRQVHAAYPYTSVMADEDASRRTWTTKGARSDQVSQSLMLPLRHDRRR